MSESPPSSNASSDTPAAPPTKPARVVSALEILKAAAEPVRHAVLQELSDGSYPTQIQLAKQLDCHPDLMGRHLRRLRRAGMILRVNPGEEADQRASHHQIPQKFHSTMPDGTHVVDYGHLVLRFPPKAKD